MKKFLVTYKCGFDTRSDVFQGKNEDEIFPIARDYFKQEYTDFRHIIRIDEIYGSKPTSIEEVEDMFPKVGNWRLLFKWINPTASADGIYIVELFNGKTAHFNPSKGKFVSRELFDDAHNFGKLFFKNVAVVMKNGKYNAINLKGEYVFDKWYDYITNSFRIDKDGKNVEVFDVHDGKEIIVYDKDGKKSLLFN